MKHIVIPAKLIRPILIILYQLRSVGDLIVRFWIAHIFFVAGMTNIAYWPTTLVLFKYDYAVPLLSPVVAAYLGTAMEFILPVFLVLGLGGRIVIFIFFIYNVITVLSFHFLWTPAGSAGLNDHINWGLLLMMLMLHGPGKYSLDYILHRRFGYLFRLGKKINTNGIMMLITILIILNYKTTA